MENRGRIASGVCGLVGQLLEVVGASRHWIGCSKDVGRKRCIMVEG
jgi:hypothetical protein